jgi:hypothetical protein
VDKRKGGATRAGTLDEVTPETLYQVKKQALGKPGKVMERFAGWFQNGEPWSTTSASEYAQLSRLSDRLPLLEQSGGITKVGIGVATGADSVFILREKSTQIEESRQLPLLMPRDVSNERLDWSGRYLVNPFEDEGAGQLVDLSNYPGLREYLKAHSAALLKRHVAKSRPQSWYRTIDRIWPELVTRQKLVIPDIQGSTTIGFDDGLYYPHHNLYWITSDTWPLLALKTVLRSSVVYQQVKAYSVQMRGGSVRFQAQTLRKLRVPSITLLSDATVNRLITVATQSQDEVDDAVIEAYSVHG